MGQFNGLAFRLRKAVEAASILIRPDEHSNNEVELVPRKTQSAATPQLLLDFLEGGQAPQLLERVDDVHHYALSGERGH
jgi:hypothetical protein